MQVVIGFKKLHPDAVVPKYANATDSGADLTAIEDVALQPGQTRLISTGIAVKLPPRYDLQCRGRSGLASKGICVLNSPGTIDNAYLGELKVILHNTTKEPFLVTKGMRIAQLVLCPVWTGVYEEIQELGTTTRGASGFGSTGI